MKYFLSALLLLGCCSGTLAQAFDKQKMDSLFDVLAANDRAMGAVALMKNGKPIYAKAIGAMEIIGGKRNPATVKTKYRIGSVTKMFTAAMIFQLVEGKKLSLTTPLADYYPTVPNAQKITIGMLLQHRSGIHNFTNDTSYMSWMEQPKTKAEMVAIIAGNKADFAPDAAGAYSNSNYVLLGFILEDVYKKPYATILKQQITAKAGLADTYYGSKPDAAKDEASSYDYDQSWKLASITNLSIPGGAGAIVSTPTDLVRFISLLFAGKIVSMESLEQMQQVDDNYGMGMFTFPFGLKKFYGHTGGIDEFASVVGYNKADSFAFAYCTNGTRFVPNNISIGVLSIYYGVPYNIPDFKTITVTPGELDKYTGIYTSPKLPITLTITKEGNVLKAQASGQSAIPLTAAGPDKFTFEQAGIVLKFTPANASLVLEQGGGTFTFTKASDK